MRPAPCRETQRPLHRGGRSQRLDRLPRRASADEDAELRPARGERRAVSATPTVPRPRAIPRARRFSAGCRRIARGFTHNRQKMREVLPDAELLPRYFSRHGYWSAGSGKMLHYIIDPPIVGRLLSGQGEGQSLSAHVLSGETSRESAARRRRGSMSRPTGPRST